MLTTSLRHRRQRGQPCEIVVELFALFLCVFEDCSDRADNGKDEAAKGNRATSATPEVTSIAKPETRCTRYLAQEKTTKETNA